jgi:hypothetical protein
MSAKSKRSIERQRSGSNSAETMPSLQPHGRKTFVVPRSVGNVT